MLHEISITDFEQIYIGQTEDSVGGTGCTVLICPDGMAAGLDVRGGGPASRESELLKPLAAPNRIHGVVLSGGSAFGLDAAGGVMQYLEEHQIGYEVGPCRVPLVCQSDLFDLTVGDCHARPDRKMGYQAAKLAFSSGNYRDGNYGAGCGASVGKGKGISSAMKSGIGSYAIQSGSLKVGALVAVNALGDIYDEAGHIIAGMRTADGKAFADTVGIMFNATDIVENKFTGNTTLGVILTNAAFDRSALCKIAGMAHNGYARGIRPVHTTVDGDSIYALSSGNVAADQDVVGTMAAEVMFRAIQRAVLSCEAAYGLPSARSLGHQ